MLKNVNKKITFTGSCVVTTTDGDTTKEVTMKNFSCTIDSEDPTNMSINSIFQGTSAKDLYKDHRAEYYEDLMAFEDQAFALQDALIAEKEAASTEE